MIQVALVILALTMHDEGQIEDEDGVEQVRVVELEQVDEVRDERNVHVRQARVTHVEEHGDPLPLLLTANMEQTCKIHTHLYLGY